MRVTKYNIAEKDCTLEGFDFENVELLRYFLSSAAKADIRQAKALAKDFSRRLKHLIVVGVGGSILGARSIIEAFGAKNVHFCGNSLDFSQFNDILKNLENENYGICYISKSGTTIESSLFFELVCDSTSKENVVVISDQNSPAHKLASKKGFHFLEIPQTIGGRFSTMTAVGAFPIFFAGINFDKTFNGYIHEIKTFLKNKNQSEELCYAGARASEEAKGKRVEVFSSFENFYQKLLPVFVQLVGESLGKNGKGLYPTSSNFTEDLHAVGQYLQEGRKSFVETIICSKKHKNSSKIAKKYQKINNIALNSTIEAHKKADNSIVKIELEGQDEKSVGTLLAFMQLAVIVSGFLTKTNPFGQNGVEAYKNNMRKMLNAQ